MLTHMLCFNFFPKRTYSRCSFIRQTLKYWCQKLQKQMSKIGSPDFFSIQKKLDFFSCHFLLAITYSKSLDFHNWNQTAQRAFGVSR